jgi:hypothetical protein
MLVCPLCGKEQDPAGPGVGSIRDDDLPAEHWESYWIPFIEDIRGGPGHLVHPECFAREHNLSDLITLVTTNDRRMRIDLSRSPSQR